MRGLNLAPLFCRLYKKDLNPPIRLVGCTNIRDAAAAEVLRTMGGFTAILRETIDRIIDGHRINPRVRDTLELLRNDLLQNMPAMRQQIQQHLQRVSLIGRRSPVLGGGGELGEGSYHELRLRADALDFVGIIDLLQLEHGRCTIWEFKTGLPYDRHIEQLRTYALLWIEDKHRNPNQLPVQRLVLSYGQHVKELPPPDAPGLVALRAQLQERILGAAASLRTDPPIARPNTDHCKFCGVRHLCPEYWAGLPTWHEEDRQGGIDVEVRVGRARGPRSWDADLLVAAGTAKPRPVVLIMANTSPTRYLDEGMHVRLLNVRHHVDDGVTLIGISAFSEMFRIR
jgi:PD-(D/E)XK nuclease superfamily